MLLGFVIGFVTASILVGSLAYTIGRREGEDTAARYYEAKRRRS